LPKSSSSCSVSPNFRPGARKVCPPA
jgi:hypothetical protein